MKIFLPVALALSTALFGDASDARFQLPSIEAEANLPGEGALRRYDGYLKGWPNRRSAFAERTEQDRNAVVFLGDSITQAWGFDFRSLFPDAKLANRGISGDTTRGMLIRLEEDVLALDPQAIVLLMGTNDIGEGTDPEAIGRNFGRIIERIKAHSPSIPIVVCRIFPSSPEKKRPSETIQALNEIYEDAVRGDPQITVLDTWTLFANESGDAHPQWFPDLLHLNEEGYRRWANALKPIFASIGVSETEPDDFAVESGFRSLFNGTDLTGWGVKETQPKRPPRKGFVWVGHESDIAYDGMAYSHDGRYAAINGRLVVLTPSEGRRIQQLWTTEEFGGDFVLRLDFRATPNADSGVFLRGKQFQVRDYALAGPYKDLESYRPQEWNSMEFSVKGTKATVSCNGQVIVDDFEIPESGPIGLEGDRGQIEYRRIRIGL